MTRRAIRHLLLMATTALLVAAGTPTAVAEQAPGVREEADRIMNLTFLDFAAAQAVPPFDWSNDGCTVTPTWEMALAFAGQCAQHDFGYRNYGGQGALKLSPTQETKNWIDERFWHEMRRMCLEGATGWPQSVCLGNAKIMYDGVQAFGGSYFF